MPCFSLIALLQNSAPKVQLDGLRPFQSFFVQELPADAC